MIAVRDLRPALRLRVGRRREAGLEPRSHRLRETLEGSIHAWVTVPRPATLPVVVSAIPNGAAGAIDRYLDAVDAAVPNTVVGLHVTGSLALGDYVPERSD